MTIWVEHAGETWGRGFPCYKLANINMEKLTQELMKECEDLRRRRAKWNGTDL